MERINEYVAANIVMWLESTPEIALLWLMDISNATHGIQRAPPPTPTHGLVQEMRSFLEGLANEMTKSKTDALHASKLGDFITRHLEKAAAVRAGYGYEDGGDSAIDDAVTTAFRRGTRARTWTLLERVSPSTQADVSARTASASFNMPSTGLEVGLVRNPRVDIFAVRNPAFFFAAFTAARWVLRPETFSSFMETRDDLRAYAHASCMGYAIKDSQTYTHIEDDLMKTAISATMDDVPMTVPFIHIVTPPSKNDFIGSRKTHSIWKTVMGENKHKGSIKHYLAEHGYRDVRVRDTGNADVAPRDLITLEWKRDA
jgi:hypothetical protein